MKKLYFLLFFSCSFIFQVHAQQEDTTQLLQIVYSSDAHFGLSKKRFRGTENVSSRLVNTVMITTINSMPGINLPNDNGIGSGRKIGYIDYFAQTGDIANRQELPYQSATESWKEFEQVYLNGLTTKNKFNQKTGFLIVPGNHDISNAIGYTKPMQPLTDVTSMDNIYNLMMHPSVPLTNATFNYAINKVNYSRDMAGIHFLFINIWPDSLTRIWINKDLMQISNSTTVIIFAHDPPEGDPRHFINPHEPHNINGADKFENLLTEQFKDSVLSKKEINDNIEQRAFVVFLKAHPNIKAYFHGHNNANEFYTYKGPDNDIWLPTFRVDSPMKGKPSATDESKLSYQFITIDPQTQKMTVRECLWNTNPGSIVWGNSVTISL
jgi:hypothetical protein